MRYALFSWNKRASSPSASGLTKMLFGSADGLYTPRARLRTSEAGSEGSLLPGSSNGHRAALEVKLRPVLEGFGCLTEAFVKDANAGFKKCYIYISTYFN